MRHDISSCFLIGSDSKSTFAGAGSVSEGAWEKPGLLRVLVVDDEILIADTVTKILNQSGFIARAVYSGEDAILAAETLCPDIVLSDVLMPKINGVEAAIIIKKSCPDTRIVLFSGQAATGEILTEARKQGYDFELLPKPIHPLQLLKRLRD